MMQKEKEKKIKIHKPMPKAIEYHFRRKKNFVYERACVVVIQRK